MKFNDITLIILVGGLSSRFEKDSNLKINKFTFLLQDNFIFKNFKYNFIDQFNEIIISVGNLNQETEIKNNLSNKINDIHKIRFIIDYEIPHNGPIRGIISCIPKIKTKYVFFLPGDTLLIGKKDISELYDNFLKNQSDIGTFLVEKYGPQLLSFLSTTKWLKQAISVIESTIITKFRNIRITDLYRYANEILFSIYEDDSLKINQFLNINDKSSYLELIKKLEILHSIEDVVNNSLIFEGALLISNNFDLIKKYRDNNEIYKFSKETILQTKWPSEVFIEHILKDWKLLSENLGIS